MAKFKYPVNRFFLDLEDCAQEADENIYRWKESIQKAFLIPFSSSIVKFLAYFFGTFLNLTIIRLLPSEFQFKGSLIEVDLLFECKDKELNPCLLLIELSSSKNASSDERNAEHCFVVSFKNRDLNVYSNTWYFTNLKKPVDFKPIRINNNSISYSTNYVFLSELKKISYFDAIYEKFLNNDVIEGFEYIYIGYFITFEDILGANIEQFYTYFVKVLALIDSIQDKEVRDSFYSAIVRYVAVRYFLFYKKGDKEVNKMKDEITKLMYDRYGNFIGRFAAEKVAEKVAEKEAEKEAEKVAEMQALRSEKDAEMQALRSE
ncbi:MAG: hypothetical protein LBK52_08040, partial [Deltaproteobacteria bacterium]|nr:hypothetical protein [Deltaproteobacteria bacterium]